jgi:D-alanyl-D-alanine endopeptidase (penicillin-binding protein 7)
MPSPRYLRLTAQVLALVLFLAVASPEAVVLSGSGPATAEAATTTAKKSSASKAKTSKRTTAKKSTSKKKTSKSKRKKKGSKSRRRSVPLYGSRAAFIMDAKTGEVLFEKNAGSPLPVASLTKLMTTITFLETEPDLDRTVAVAREDLTGSGKTQLRSGEKLTVRDLLYHSLMSSDNAATKTLVRISGVPSDEFLARMNRKANVLGLHGTRFVEFTGLDAGNISTAADMAQLLKYASGQTVIAHVTSQPEYFYRSSRRAHHLVNTNRLARYHQLEVKSGKTGYISKAGYCLAMWVRSGSRDLIAVVLGAPSNPARFAETRRILQELSQSESRTPVGVSTGVIHAVGPR